MARNKSKTLNESTGSHGPLFEQQSELPPHASFPINRKHTHHKVKDLIEPDLKDSVNSIIITGFSSLWYLVNFLGNRHGWEKREKVRLAFGFNLVNRMGRPKKPDLPSLEEEVALLEEGFSPNNWSNLWRLINLLENNTIEVRFLSHLHAKIYVGDNHATLGSSNFSSNGLQYQHEANIRVCRTGPSAEAGQYDAFKQLANYFFYNGEPFNDLLLTLLRQQLLLTNWEETLARAISELLEKPWFNTVQELHHHLNHLDLWPTQKDGINQALQTLQEHNCVLIADPTGSGKTKLVTTLVLILTHWLWMKGHKFRSRIETVCPKHVKVYWEQEADHVGFVPRHSMSDGTISGGSLVNKENALKRLKKANILVVDEAHRFLRPKTTRTKALKCNHADFLILSTATPLSKHPKDIVRLIELFGVDVLPQPQLDAFIKLRKDLQKSISNGKEYNDEDLEKLRDYLKNLLVRRTKKQINQHLAQQPVPHKLIPDKDYFYPKQKDTIYPLDCRESDIALSHKILNEAENLKGLVFLEKLNKDKFWNGSQTDKQFIQNRLKAAKGIAKYKVQALLRSSRAALIEHILGTDAATKHLNFTCNKNHKTGNIEKKLQGIENHLPESNISTNSLENWDWLIDLPAYQRECSNEITIYSRIAEYASQMSDDREKRKAEELKMLCKKFPRVLAFDSTLITLDYLFDQYLKDELNLSCHVPRSNSSQQRVILEFGLDSSMKATHLALLSDAMSEGVNLPRAQAVLMLDQPSILRLAEQRIGRIDRLNSPYDEIHVYWPGDKSPFVLKKDIRLFKANAAVRYLFGSNITVPEPEHFIEEEQDGNTEVDGAEFMKAYREKQEEDVTTEASSDAFEPVRKLYNSETGIISPMVYEQMKKHKIKIKTKISIGESETAWFFVALRATVDLPPRWYLLDEISGDYHIKTDLSMICADLASKLTGVRKWYKAKDWDANNWDDLQPKINSYVSNLRSHQLHNLPPQKRRALKKAKEILVHYLKKKNLSIITLQTIESLKKTLPDPDSQVNPVVDPYICAEQWIELLRPYQRKLQDEALAKNGNKLYSLSDIPAKIVKLEDATFEWLLKEAPTGGAQWEQVVACIVAIPEIKTALSTNF